MSLSLRSLFSIFPRNEKNWFHHFPSLCAVSDFNFYFIFSVSSSLVRPHDDTPRRPCDIVAFLREQSPTPPSTTVASPVQQQPSTPKTVSDKKKFFENVMEDQQKPAPKTGKKMFFGRTHNL